MIKFSDKIAPKTSKKKWARVKKKRDSSKFWIKNRDCPSKSGTVGKYEIAIKHYTKLSFHPSIH